MPRSASASHSRQRDTTQRELKRALELFLLPIAKQVLRDANGNRARVGEVCEKLLDFCFQKLARGDFGVTTCEV
jgi:hypothetical protein